MTGGFIAGMTDSLKNNRQLLHTNKDRRKYAMKHHAEEKVHASLKEPKVDPLKLRKLKEKIRFKAHQDHKKQRFIIVLFVLLAFILFIVLFVFLGV